MSAKLVKATRIALFVAAVFLLITAARLVWAEEANAQAPPAIQPGQWYVVQDGDTCWSIVRKFDLPSCNALYNNNVTRMPSPQLLYRGSTLWIPGRINTTLPVITRNGDGTTSTSPIEYIYWVKPGDTVSQIAERYGVPISSIVRRNNLRSAGEIWSGMRLYIPSSSSIRRPSPTATPRGAMYHTVVRGDTLYSLSRKYHISVTQLQTMNGMTSNQTVIFIGQRLRVR
jgi:LysM repeat protein